MMAKFTAYEFSLIVDEYFMTRKDEIGIMHLYYEILNFIYVNIYEYESFTYDLNTYINSMYEEHPPLPF